MPDPATASCAEPSAAERACLAAILAIVRGRCGTDFRGYRARVALRRVRNRMAAAGARSLPEYLARVRADPLETRALLERLTIKVSRFFRNPESVAAVRDALAERRASRPGTPLTIWSAGCGRGEEPYTLAMLLAEMGEPASEGASVLGTDIDDAALGEAASGRFRGEEIEDVPEAMRPRYVEPADGRALHRIRDGLRRRVELRRHDLTREEAPPDRRTFDLVACRNVLIYLQPRLRHRVEALLIAAVARGGLLWLGEAEWPGPRGPALEVVDRRARLFRVPAEGAA